MKVLFISPNSPFESIGGIERYLLNLIEYYKTREDSEAYIMIPSKEGNRVEKIGKVVIFHDNSLFLFKGAAQNEVSKKARLFSLALGEIINSEKIDVICGENFHLGLPPAYSLMLNMIGVQYRIPLVLRLHSFASIPLQVELINQLAWNMISCVSKSVAGDCFHKGTDINLLSTDYLGVNRDEFFKYKLKDNSFRKDLGLNKEDKVIVTASRIIHGRKNILVEKGIINLIEAFSRLSPRFPTWKLLIAVGKPPENLKDEFNYAYEMLLGYIKLHNVEEKTVVKTFKLNEMNDVYNNSDVFVLPSENETFGQVFIEAMACELPVIGTKVGGIPEIISDTHNGFLVIPNDASFLAQRIEKLITDNKLRKSYVKEGLKTVDTVFTASTQFSDFHHRLEKLKIAFHL